jgi:hypothetical protein
MPRHYSMEACGSQVLNVKFGNNIDIVKSG